jgi:hypothetical protein
MYFDLDSLLTPAENLKILEEPFTKEESMPNHQVLMDLMEISLKNTGQL